MAVKLEVKEFTKPGRVAEGATPEKFTCNQVAEGSVAYDTVDNFCTDVLELANGDWKVAAAMFEEGFNRYTRINASGSDEATKLAKQIVKSGLSAAIGVGGKDVNEIAQLIRDGKIKVG